jgi:acetyl esterase/lipase
MASRPTVPISIHNKPLDPHMQQPLAASQPVALAAATTAARRMRRAARTAAAVILLNLARCAPADLLNATIPTGGLTISHDIAYGDEPREKLDIYRPAQASGLPVVVFIYGGSWRTGSKAMYRLYPQVIYPAFLQDCARAVAWAQSHRAVIGSNGPLFLMGHSAGAYNAAMMGLDPEWLAATGTPLADVAGVIGLAGPYDFLPITDPDIIPVFPDAGAATQPITYAGPGKPPLLLLTGTDDREVRPRNTLALAAKMQAAHGQVTVHTYKGIGHVGLITAIAPIFQWRAPVLRDVMAFIRSQTTFQGSAHVAKPSQPAT